MHGTAQNRRLGAGIGGSRSSADALPGRKARVRPRRSDRRRNPGREVSRQGNDLCAAVVQETTENSGADRQAGADEKRHEDTGHLEREIEKYLRRRTRELALDLHPFKVRLPLSGRKAVIYFSAEKRVDYRPLQRDLGKRYRRRIEMRSLGVRDGARMCGGLGPCGRCLCCTTFMDRFHSVTVRMAKRQNLSLNPTKISGLCGRLMCCLSHEVEQYPEQPRGRR